MSIGYDPDLLADIHRECFGIPRPWSADEIAATGRSPGVFVEACADGFVIGRAIADEAELLTLAVRPVVRRQGRGAALLDRFLDEAAKRGAARAFLEVAATNAAAIALYEAAGFTLAGRRPGYYAQSKGDAVGALVYSRDLTGRRSGI